MADRFLIGYVDSNSGYQTNVKPWLLPDNAFSNLENAYVFRGRVRKRLGSAWTGYDQYGSRLRYQLTNTDTSGDGSGTVPGSIFAVGQQFTINDVIFTVNALGEPATLLSTNPSASMTYNTTTGEYTITGADIDAEVFFYPATPVMGLAQRYKPQTKDYDNIAFDGQFSYLYDDVSYAWLAITSGTSTWTPASNSLFWSYNYRGATLADNLLWTTNFNTTDGIRYFDGATWITEKFAYFVGGQINTTNGSGAQSGTAPGSSWFIGQVFTIQSNNNTTFFKVVNSSGSMLRSGTNGGTGSATFDTVTGAYSFTGCYIDAPIFFSETNYIASCLMIVEFYGRMILLNTIENVSGVPTNFYNRIRYSGVSNPTLGQFFISGGFVNAPVQEAIVTAQFIKDRLIVYFTNSTYELVFTKNEVNPFIFQKLNTELGAESTFSEVPFDRNVLGIDNIGIHACNGSNVERIDDRIPQTVFGFANDNDERDKIVGIRDYYTEMVYWAHPNSMRNADFKYNNRLLAYNYKNNSWAEFEDSITFMGYFPYQKINQGATWGNTTTTWQDLTVLWNSNADTFTTPKVQAVIAGNQEGYVFIMHPDLTVNAGVLQVTDVSDIDVGTMTLTIINHNLQFNNFILLSTMNGLTFTDSNNKVLSTVMAKIQDDPYTDGTPNSVTVLLLDNENQAVTITGTYIGGGTAARVSNMNITTKQYNPYTSSDRGCFISKIDFLVDKTNQGAVSVDYYISSSSNPIVSGSTANSVLPGTNVLETSPYALVTFEKFQDRLWHPLYFYASGECIQYNIYMSETQMFNYTIDPNGTIVYTAQQDFQLHAMALYAQPTSIRMQ